MIRKRQRGIAILPLLIACAVVVLMAVGISIFITSQNRTSVKISNSGQCNALAKSVNEFILKDENTLFVNSFGPAVGSPNYPNNVGETPDGFFRMNNTIPVLVATGATFVTNATHSARVAIPSNWTLSNSLNINNSINRLAALATPKQLCCESLDLDENDCGNIIYDTEDLANSISGLNFGTEKVKIRIGVNFQDTSGDICNGRVLNPTRLPVSSKDAWAEYVFRITLNASTPNEKVCEGRGRVSFAPDQTSPVPLLEYDMANLCGHGINTGVICTNSNTASEAVTVRVKTVSNTPNCKAQCFDRLQVPSCSATPGPQALSDALCNQNCQEMDPGSIYFCRIGERNWFLNNPNYWEPCHLAQVHDFDGSDAGDVSIEHTPRFSDGSRTETTTLATIRLTNLRSDRSYQVDVRAVDTKGLFMGPSFCSLSNSCLNNASLTPAFVVNQSAPVLQDLVETTEIVEPASGEGAGVFAGEFQCMPGTSTWEAVTNYNLPAGVYSNFNLDTSCSGYIGNGNPPGANCLQPWSACTGSVTCVCDGKCIAQSLVGGVSDTANITLNVSITNACNKVSNSKEETWCYDTIPVNEYSVATTDASPAEAPVVTPIIRHSVFMSKKEVCGIAFNIPSNGLGDIWTLNPRDQAIANWIPSVHSGCRPIPGGAQYCTRTRDACGRFKNAVPTPYSSTLDIAPTTYKCSVDPVAGPVDGYGCAVGLFCDSSYQCKDTCANINRDCNNKGLPSGDPVAPCKNATDCPGQHGSCSTTYTCRTAHGDFDQNCILDDSCTQANFCLGATRRCTGGSPPHPDCTYNEYGCFAGQTCGAPEGGTCSVSGLACVAGVCPDVNGTCAVKVQGTCSCPDGRTCPGSGSIRNCPTLSTCI